MWGFKSFEMQLWLVHEIFKQILVIDGRDIFCETALRWLWLDLTNDKSPLFEIHYGSGNGLLPDGSKPLPEP